MFTSIFQIRAKTELKRLKKNIEKIKSLDATNVKIETSDNDRGKMSTKKAVLDLARKMTMTDVNNENEGLTINSSDASINIFTLSSEKKKSQDLIWKNIQKSSASSEFDVLFQQ